MEGDSRRFPPPPLRPSPGAKRAKRGGRNCWDRSQHGGEGDGEEKRGGQHESGRPRAGCGRQSKLVHQLFGHVHVHLLDPYLSYQLRQLFRVHLVPLARPHGQGRVLDPRPGRIFHQHFHHVYIVGREAGSYGVSYRLGNLLLFQSIDHPLNLLFRVSVDILSVVLRARVAEIQFTFSSRFDAYICIYMYMYILIYIFSLVTS